MRSAELLLRVGFPSPYVVTDIRSQADHLSTFLAVRISQPCMRYDTTGHGRTTFAVVNRLSSHKHANVTLHDSPTVVYISTLIKTKVGHTLD